MPASIITYEKIPHVTIKIQKRYNFIIQFGKTNIRD